MTVILVLSTAQGRSIYSQGQWPLVRRVFTTSLNKHPAIDMKYFQQCGKTSEQKVDALKRKVSQELAEKLSTLENPQPQMTT
jgi:hypothetical protein